MKAFLYYLLGSFGIIVGGYMVVRLIYKGVEVGFEGLEIMDLFVMFVMAVVLAGSLYPRGHK